ncbi:MAG: S8 family serine peptidase [Solirubrobacterales bacterium]
MRNTSIHLLAFLTTLVVVLALQPVGSSATGAAAPGTAAGQRVLPGQDYIEGQVLVQFSADGIPEVIPVPATSDEEAVAEMLEARPGIATASPNYIARISRWIPDDPGVDASRSGGRAGWQKRQWNLLPCHSLCSPDSASNSLQSRGGANVIRAWQNLRQAGRAGARGVRIAVLDSGVAYRDFGRGFLKNPDFGPQTFLPGYDFVQNDKVPLDLNGHGTHITATIAQATNNGRGLTGIAYGAKIIPVRVIDQNGYGSTLNIIRGIRWAADSGARVINMSLNFECGASIPALDSALLYAYEKGVVLVGSAGNIGSQTCPSPPATSPVVIAVGGTTESGCLASYSFKDSRIDIAAPGGGRQLGDCPFSAANRGILQVAMVGRDPRWFGIENIWSGTSMAAAHVSAGAAMILASKALGDGRGPLKVKERLTATARMPAYAEGDPASGFGAGIIDLGRATNPAVQLPG